MTKKKQQQKINFDDGNGHAKRTMEPREAVHTHQRHQWVGVEFDPKTCAIQYECDTCQIRYAG